MSKKMSHKITKILKDDGNELNELLYRYFLPSFRKGYMEVGANKVLLPFRYEDFKQDIEDFEVFDSDIWVVSHPKTGTTWTQEMVWCINNDLNYEAAKVTLKDRFPFIETSILYDPTDVLPEEKINKANLESVKKAQNAAYPRHIKTHLAWELLPKDIRCDKKKPKIIYVARNAKDACVSYFHHCVAGEGYKGDFETFVKLFIGGKISFGPFWPHILSFWKKRNEENILFIKYEDMKRDLPSVINEVASFLGKSLNYNQIKILAEHLSFDAMKNNEFVNMGGGFIRSGIVGSYKIEMTQQMIEIFDKWTEENLTGTGLYFEK